MRFIARLIQRCICRYARRVYATGRTPRWYQRWLFRFEGWLEYEVIRRPLTNERLQRIAEKNPWPDEHFYGNDDLDLP